MEDARYAIGASGRRTEVKGTDELPQLDSLTRACSADLDRELGLEPCQDI